MFPKIDRFGVARPYAFNRFEESFNSYSSTSSGECIVYTEEMRGQAGFHHDNFSSGDGLFVFTNDWSSSEFSMETSTSSKVSMRAAINDMLTKDIFGCDQQRNLISFPRKSSNGDVYRLENTRRRTRFYVSSDESLRTYASETSDNGSFDFLDDLFDESSIVFAANSVNTNAIALHDELSNISSCNRIQQPKTEPKARFASSIMRQSLRDIFSEQTWPSSSQTSFESVLSSKSAPALVRSGRTLTIVEISDESPFGALTLCDDDGGIIDSPRNSRKSVHTLDYTYSKRENSHQVVNEILEFIINEIEESNRNYEESEVEADILFIIAAFHQRFYPPGRMVETPPEGTNSSNKCKTLAITSDSNDLAAVQALSRKSSRDLSRVTSKERSFEQNILYGVQFNFKAPVLTVSDFDEPHKRRSRKSERNTDTMIVPFRARNNYADVDFDAEVQLIIQEFYRRVKRIS